MQSSFSMNEGRNSSIGDFAFTSIFSKPPSNLGDVTSTDTSRHGYTELDTHTNMVCLGQQALVFNDDGKTCGVTLYDPSLGTKHAVMALAYEDPSTGEVFILVFFNALHMPEM